MYGPELRNYWHPVCQVAELEGGPAAVRLLDEDLVVYRSGGEVRCLADLCVHRGTRLSMGWLDDAGCIVCPYHGWTYNTDGACVRIPALPKDNQRIPSRARVPRYDACENYGLVWVALDEPTAPVPEYPDIEEAGFHTFCVGRWEWSVSADRFVENAIDVAHLPFVHPGLLGDPDHPEVEPHDVIDQGNTFYFSNDRLDVDAAQFGDPGETIRRETWVTMPYTWRIRITSDRGVLAVLVAVQPVSERSCRFWPVIARNHSLEVSDEEFGSFDVTIINQDQVIVESQRPEMVPFDLSDELHLKVADLACVEYRRRLRKLLGYT